MTMTFSGATVAYRYRLGANETWTQVKLAKNATTATRTFSVPAAGTKVSVAGVDAAGLPGPAVSRVLQRCYAGNLGVADTRSREGDALRFRVTLGKPAAADVSFVAATAVTASSTPGADYDALEPATYTIPAGELAVDVVVSTLPTISSRARRP